MLPPKVWIAGGVLALTFGAGWFSNGWRLDAQIARIEATQSDAVAAANASALQLQKKLDGERDAHANELAAIDKRETEKLRLANDETNRLRTCVANGTCGLRVNVVGPACPSAVPGAAPGSSVDSGTGTALAPDAQRAYFSLRAGIVSTTAKLAACQQSLKGLTGQ